MAYFLDFGKFLDIWPWPVIFTLWPLVKVIVPWIIKCASLGCTLVPSMKSVGQIGYEIWTQVHPISCMTSEIWPLTLSQSQHNLHHQNSSNMFYHYTKFEVDRSNGIQIYWNLSFSRLKFSSTQAGRWFC